MAEREAARCVMALRVHPQPGYPFLLDLRLEYALGDEGLRVALRALNAGDAPLPFGAGFHPYLTAGTATVDPCRLQAPASEWLPADERGIPTGERTAVEGTPLDFREPREIGGAVIDHCLTGLARDGAGRATVRLSAPDGGEAALWMDGLFGHVMVFTGDTLEPERRRAGLAVEPMTCPPDAFNSGDGLLVIGPGESVAGAWGIATGLARS